MVQSKLRLSLVPWIGPKSSSPAGVLPSTVGVDGERAEDDGQGGKAVECALVDCVWKKETREKYPSMVLITRAFKKRHFLSADDGRTHWYSDDIAADILAWTLPHLCYVVFLSGAAESDSSSRCVLGICLPLQFATFDDVEEGFGSHDRRQFFTNLKFLHDASDESHGAFRDFLVHDKMEVIFFRRGGTTPPWPRGVCSCRRCGLPCLPRWASDVAAGPPVSRGRCGLPRLPRWVSGVVVGPPISQDGVVCRICQDGAPDVAAGPPVPRVRQCCVRLPDTPLGQALGFIGRAGP
jgi:hypothetical protein